MKCNSCNSEKIVQGRIFNQVDYISPAAYFRPSGLRAFALLDVNVRIKNVFSACLDCGYMWAHVDQEKVKKIIELKGTDSAKAKLNL
jgi:hypothetical protein